MICFALRASGLVAGRTGGAPRPIWCPGKKKGTCTLFLASWSADSSGMDS